MLEKERKPRNPMQNNFDYLDIENRITSGKLKEKIHIKQEKKAVIKAEKNIKKHT